MKQFWKSEATGQSSAGVVTVPAKWSYGDALAQITKLPTFQLTANDTDLNINSLVDESAYESQYNVLYVTMNSGTTPSHYGQRAPSIVPFNLALTTIQCGPALIVSDFALPNLVATLGYIPASLAF